MHTIIDVLTATPTNAVEYLAQAVCVMLAVIIVGYLIEFVTS